MNKFFLAVCFLILSVAVSAQQTLNDAESKVGFTIKNMGIDVNGTLKGLNGKIQFDPKNLNKSSFDVTVDVNTINTDNAKRDAHLKTDDFFDAVKYPVIRIVSSQMVSKGGNNYKAVGMLTIKNVTKKIGFDFTATPTAVGYTFTSAFVINRKDFGVGGSSMIMGDEVKVSLNIKATK